jgi:hypothetical protein
MATIASHVNWLSGCAAFEPHDVEGSASSCSHALILSHKTPAASRCFCHGHAAALHVGGAFTVPSASGACTPLGGGCRPYLQYCLVRVRWQCHALPHNAPHHPQPALGSWPWSMSTQPRGDNILALQLKPSCHSQWPRPCTSCSHLDPYILAWAGVLLPGTAARAMARGHPSPGDGCTCSIQGFRVHGLG